MQNENQIKTKKPLAFVWDTSLLFFFFFPSRLSLPPLWFLVVVVVIRLACCCSSHLGFRVCTCTRGEERASLSLLCVRYDFSSVSHRLAVVFLCTDRCAFRLVPSSTRYLHPHPPTSALFHPCFGALLHSFVSFLACPFFSLHFWIPNTRVGLSARDPPSRHTRHKIESGFGLATA